MTRRGSFAGIGEGLTKAEKVAEEVTRDLSAAGIHAAIVGGLAVAAYGYPRATADVDLLVVEGQRIEGVPLGIPGVSFVRGGVPVDALFIGKDEGFLRDAVFRAEGEPPILPLPALVYLKLKARRAKDVADIVELLKVDMAERVPAVRSWLRRHSPRMAERFESIVSMAREET
jgi:hypothetical protein